MSAFLTEAIRLARRPAAAVLAVALLAPVAPAVAAPRGPDSIADLSERVLDAVVNIQTSQKIEAKSGGLRPQFPPGSPLEDLFEEFFNRRGGGQQGDNKDKAPARKTSSLGSGFVIDEAGIVVTNNHVIADADEITVVFNDGQKLKAELVGRDQKVDLAVLRVKPEKPLRAVKFGDSSKSRIGEWVVAIGNPFGLGGSVTAGIISARNRDINSGPYDNFIQTDAAINRGNSGGPLFNLDGEVIGINTAIISPSGGSIGIGFAVPSSMAAPVIEQLQKYGETRRGWLGVKIQQVTDEIADSLGMKPARGALVAGIDDKGPAKPAGIETGDVIVKFDGKDIKEMRDLPRAVADTPVDKEVPVVVLRKGKEVTKTVKIARLAEAEVKEATARPDREIPAPKAATQKVLGMELSELNADARKRFKVKDSIKGVVVADVENGSSAAERRISAGEVIVEVAQEAVTKPEDVVKRIEALRKDGRKAVLLQVANGEGEVRFVPLPLN